MNKTRVYTRFYQSQPAYRSKNNFYQLAAVPDISHTHNTYRTIHASICRSRISIIKIVHFKPFDPDLSLDLVLHQPMRSLLSSDQAMHHQPITLHTGSNASSDIQDISDTFA